LRKRVIFGLIVSPSLIVFSIIMSLYTYHYETTNRVGVVGDLVFNINSIFPYIFSFISGILSLITFILAARNDRRKRNVNVPH
jgi:TRAP-type C4-dicarboxylate transport system permease small subunit